ncbi:hypothetical protein [Cellulomonas sp. Leaf395]|uniref:hypothetical protein n=1 Tax=Cellulomonas sp. Leaf395 TaxID=1736362 RepID=UPI0006F4B5B9|nr:hypothetical protein [Cellulomonas sp. Leaf395]KQT02056.1 hypothetical protein ASG23_01425 [Cellulomonas sp. Leaf395]
MSELDDVVDDLYSGAPAEFIARRDAAVKAARADKDRALAEAIGELRKPTVSAWLVNLLVRDDADLATQIVALGEGLREAEKSLDGPALRELSKQRRQLVRSLVARARKLAQPTGQKIGDAVVQELDATLTAALADPAVAREVVSGRLTAAREYAGFGSAETPDAEASTPAPAPPRPPKPPKATPARGKLRLVGESERADPTGESAAERDRRRRREEREQRARDEAQAAWEQAERVATEARRRHDAAVAAREESAAEVARTEEAAARAHQEEDDLVRALAEARRRLAAAGKAATVADKEVGTAQQTLRADERELATAERELHRAERTRDSAAAAREAASRSD